MAQVLAFHKKNICMTQRSAVCLIQLHHNTISFDSSLIMNRFRVIINNNSTFWSPCQDKTARGGRVAPRGGFLPTYRARHPFFFLAKMIMPFYFKDTMQFIKEIFAYQEFDELLVIDQFQIISSMVIETWASIRQVGLLSHVMPQSHPTTGPVRVLSPVRFLARKAEWSARRNFTSVLFPWSHQATGPVRLDTAVYLWFGWIIRMTPRIPLAVRAGIVRAPYGNLQCFSYPTGPVRGPCGTRKGAVRRPYGHARELTQPELAKIPHRRRILPCGARTGPVRFPYGLFTGCLKYLNPYGACKLIMHALKLYGPRTGRQNSYGAARGPCGPVSGRTIFV